MPRKKSVWIKKNADKLTKLYPAHTQKECADLLGVTLRAIRAQVTILKLKKRVRGWTKAEDRYLLKNYPDSSKKELAAHFKKCRQAIINRYNHLIKIKK